MKLSEWLADYETRVGISRDIEPRTGLVRGHKYDVATLSFAGWTVGDGSGTEGYRLIDYFDADGVYLGPDQHGIEPRIN